MNKERTIFLFWILYAIPAVFFLQYVRPELIKLDDPFYTAENIQKNDFLYRAGLMSHVFSQIFLLLFGISVFKWFKDYSKAWSYLFIASIGVAVVLTVANSLNYLAALNLIGSVNHTANDQFMVLTMLFLKLANYGQAFYEIFWGLYFISFGALILKSRRIPVVFGYLLILGGLGFPINTLEKIVFPDFYPLVFTKITMLLSGLGFLPAILYILIKGIKRE